MRQSSMAREHSLSRQYDGVTYLSQNREQTTNIRTPSPQRQFQASSAGRPRISRLTGFSRRDLSQPVFLGDGMARQELTLTPNWSKWSS